MNKHNIPFPFEPYPQQRELMGKLFDCFEEGKVGLFESPTGTGKSLSMACSGMSIY
jgi:chromosome transmission fidelity protein 1